MPENDGKRKEIGFHLDLKDFNIKEENIHWGKNRKYLTSLTGGLR